MLDGIEALQALERCGTVSEAALSLRLTQSAVTKRIQALQNEVGFALTAPEGRRLRLTQAARTLLDRARPLLAELKNLSKPTSNRGVLTMSIAMADSIASSWGPGILREVLRKKSKLELRLHAHRSALVIEAVRLGRYQIGLCSTAPGITDLVSFPVLSEPFVLVHARQQKKMRKDLPLITIEAESATWPAIAGEVGAHPLLKNLEIVRVESFSAAFQMAAAGFGHALVPVGLAKAMRAKRGGYRSLPQIRREISLFTRKTVSQQEAFLEFAKALEARSRKLQGRKK